jgi:nucleotide-binding universal stress UspA family protein
MKILIGYIDTPQGHAALEVAINEAKAHGAKLRLVHYIREPGENPAQARGRPRAVDRAQALLESAADRVQRAGVTCETKVLEGGTELASHAIVEDASSENVDRIVIGLRRRSAVGKVMLGSNAQDILFNADCPVISVKAV